MDGCSALINIIVLPLGHFLLNLLSLLEFAFFEITSALLEIVEHLALLEDKVHIIEVSSERDTMLIQLVEVLFDHPSDFFLELLRRILRAPVKALQEVLVYNGLNHAINSVIRSCD